jgi:2-polyprenyl-6-methoxyphenol hydroxylase-like FAD-dependent oxidoreductase
VGSTNGNEIVIVGGGIAGSALAAQLAAGGLSVDVLERTTEYPDRVRGEMYCPWGVAIADELGLLQPLLDAGAAFSTNWVFYDHALPPDVAETLGVDTSAIVPGVPGILNITHPDACQALCDHAERSGAIVHRGVEAIEIALGEGEPEVAWRDPDGTRHVRRPALVVGADGRASAVRHAAGIELHSAPVRQYMTGLLVETPHALRDQIACQGAADEVNWYNFPQGPHRSRVYLAHFDVHRYAGAGGLDRFFHDMAGCASPNVVALSEGRAVTPLATHPSVDTWTDEPCAPGAVLVGDAAGYNDPIVGQGLSLSMADVRDVAAVILAGGRTPIDFADYSAARSDRHAKQRTASQTLAELMCSFGDDAAARRLRALPLMTTDETVSLIGATLFAGPDVLPPGTEPLLAARELILSA